MPIKEVFQIISKQKEIITISINSKTIDIYNDATDATAWFCSIPIKEWMGIKKYIDQQIKNNNDYQKNKKRKGY